MADRRRCQWPGVHAPERCDGQAELRIQLGTYAGAWRVCQRHAGDVIRKLAPDIAAGGWRVSIDILEVDE